jgi:hypothetical protein
MTRMITGMFGLEFEAMRKYWTGNRDEEEGSFAKWGVYSKQA